MTLAEDRSRPFGLFHPRRAVAAAYSAREVMADGCIHLLSVFGSLIAITALITIAALRQDGLTVTSVAIYGLGTVTVFVLSALYNMDLLPSRREVMRRLDRAAIFVKIAGTYTPFALLSIGGIWGIVVLSAVWTIAVVGVPLQLFAPDLLSRASVLLYLAQGWLIVIAAGPLASALPAEAFGLIMLGGVLYTIGVVFFLAERLPYHNAIWHGFVLAASACMYAAVMIGVAA